MVRKSASEGSSLFCEWAVGSTINAAMRKIEKERLEREKQEARRKRDVIKLEMTTDDESEVDSVRVTYPRSGAKRSSKKAAKSSSRAKQVRFEQGSLKPALKKKKTRKLPTYESSGSDAFTSETESGTDTARSVDASSSEPSDSEGVSTDTSSSRRRKSHKSRRSKGESSGDSDSFFDSNCSDCERDVVEKAKERKSRRKYTSDPESSTGSENVRRSKKDEKRRRHEERHSGSHKDYPVFVDPDMDSHHHGDKKSRLGKESKKRQSKGGSPKEEDHTSSRKLKSALSPKQKAYPEAMPGPHPRRPNLIRPIRAEVMQVEHTVEGPEDPRPNAFVDERNNVVRVYHGPAYGNPFGKLYPRRDPSVQPLPIGVPHPLDNPYYHGFRNSQQHDHSHSPTGHMATTLGDPYSSIPAHAPIHSGQGPEPRGDGTQDLTSGLWGIDSGPSNTTRDKASSWSNNVGPPQPSASLRKANPSSQWGFGSPKKESRKDGGDGSPGGCWGAAGDIGGDTGSWGVGGGDKKDQWDDGGDRNEGNAGDSWGQGNDNTAGGDNVWGSTDQGGGGQDINENTGDFRNDRSPSQWEGQNNDTPWDNTDGNGDSWGGDNTSPDDTWGGANGNNNDNTWEGGTDNASNNVGPPGNPPGQKDFSPSKHVPGAWGGTPQEPLPDWADTTAAQSTRNQQASHSW